MAPKYAFYCAVKIAPVYKSANQRRLNLRTHLQHLTETYARFLAPEGLSFVKPLMREIRRTEAEIWERYAAAAAVAAAAAAAAAFVCNPNPPSNTSR